MRVIRFYNCDDLHDTSIPSLFKRTRGLLLLPTPSTSIIAGDCICSSFSSLLLQSILLRRPARYSFLRLSPLFCIFFDFPFRRSTSLDCSLPSDLISSCLSVSEYPFTSSRLLHLRCPSILRHIPISFVILHPTKLYNFFNIVPPAPASIL